MINFPIRLHTIQFKNTQHRSRDMASLTPSEIFAALAALPADRAEDLLHHDADMEPTETGIFNAIAVGSKQGERQQYFSLDNLPTLPVFKNCITSGREIWGNKGEVDGKFKISVGMDPAAVNVCSILEALIRLKIAHTYPDSPDAQRLSVSQESNINVEYSQLKADLAVPPSRYPVSVYRQLQSSSVVVQVPNDSILSSYDEGGLPAVSKELDPNTRQRISTDPIKHYEVDVEVQPTIVMMGRIKWQAKRITVKGEKQKSGGVFRRPIPLAEMEDQNTTWSIAREATQGGHGNHFHPMTHSRSPNPKFSARFWLHGESDDGACPMRVAQVWDKQTAEDSAATMQCEATLALASTPAEAKSILQVCDRVKTAVADSLPDTQKKYKPPKPSKGNKPKLDWSVALNFTDPRIVQTPDKVEKWGERTDEWFKLPVTFRANPDKNTKPTPIYALDGVLKTNPEAICVQDLLNTDPEKLVADGMLKRLSSDNGFCLGKGAEIYAAVCISKVIEFVCIALVCIALVFLILLVRHSLWAPRLARLKCLLSFSDR